MTIDPIKLHVVMLRHEMSVAQLSELSGVSRATIVSARGGKSCRRDTLNRLAHALGVSLEELLPDGRKGCTR